MNLFYIMKILKVNKGLLYHVITIKRVRGQVMLSLRVCVCMYVYMYTLVLCISFIQSAEI